jgi:hypothetical protein
MKSTYFYDYDGQWEVNDVWENEYPNNEFCGLGTLQEKIEQYHIFKKDISNHKYYNEGFIKFYYVENKIIKRIYSLKDVKRILKLSEL